MASPHAFSPFRRAASRGLLFLVGVTVFWPLQEAIYLCVYSMSGDRGVPQ